MRWEVAVTTAPRKGCSLERCLDSLLDCGFSKDEITVYAEPNSTETDFNTIKNTERKGVWHNWLNSARQSLEKKPDIILTVQDDSIFHPDSKSFTESILWPDPKTGYLSLYCPKHYQHWKDGRKRPFGIYEVKTNSVWGAMALVWHPKVINKLIEHPRAKTWCGAKIKKRKNEKRSEYKKRWEKHKEMKRENPHLIQNSDTIMGIIIRKCLKRKLMYVSPSLVDHCSKNSSIGHGDNSGRRNAYYLADHSIPAHIQIPKNENYDLI